MTIGDMRRLMLKKVVPESLVPQNIIDFLIDENAQLPEPDAFTFLNRLRGLGIGSADFLYLLEGCGAPQQAVDKIKANPAMNLQGLIVTLEGSGMTSKDYTRILYTARQIWERTLTLRLETSEQLSHNEDAENAADRDNAKAPASENVTDNAPEDGGEDLVKISLPRKKQSSPYPDATEELMSVDFGSDYDFEENKEQPPEEKISAASELSEDTAADYNEDFAGTESGGEAQSGEFGYSERFAESFVNDYMVDFAEDDLGDLSDDETFSDNMGVYYGDLRNDNDIPEVGSADPVKAEEHPAAAPVGASDRAASGIPDVREPFEVHIASYDIPEEPDEFEKARESSANTEGSDDPDSSESFDVSFSENDRKENDSDGIEFVDNAELPKKNTAPFEVVIDYGDEEPEAEPVQPFKPEQPAGQYNGETTRLIPINRELVERNISAMAPDADSGGDNVKTAVQKPAAKTAKQRAISDEADGNEGRSAGLTDISRNFGRSDISGSNYREDEDGGERKSSGTKKGLIIAAGVGAAVLVGANFAVSHFLGGNDNKVRYAGSADEIFVSIYYSNVDKVTGGDTVFGYKDDYAKTFGDLLICGTGLGTVTAGNNVYSVSENKITASVFSNEAVNTLGQFEPADGTKFVAAAGSGDSLIAVFNGSGEDKSGSCGYIMIKGENVVYTVRQSGKLTDFKFEDGEIKLGSVYTPGFYEDFDSERTDIYLPKVGTSYSAIDPKDVILSRTKGYSYAISGGYSIDSGAVTLVKAALGDPVYADADGTFFLNGKEEKKNSAEEYGLIISAGLSDEDMKFERCGKIGCAAAFGGGSAVYEQSAEGGETVLRDKDLKICSSKMRSADIPTHFRFSDNTLIADGANGIVFTADCTDINAVKLNNLRLVNGDCGEKSAITLEPDEGGVKLVRYILENGEAKEHVSVVQQLSEDMLKTLVCGTKNTMAVGSDIAGASFSYFDGVSVISVYVTIDKGSPKNVRLYDDKTGFEYAFLMNGKVYAVCSKGALDIAQSSSENTDPAGAQVQMND